MCHSCCFDLPKCFQVWQACAVNADLMSLAAGEHGNVELWGVLKGSIAPPGLRNII